jgi:hypothetical protein
MLPRNDPANLYLRHQLVIAVGDWGKDTLSFLASALDNSHPELIHTLECLEVNASGIRWFNWLPALAIGNYNRGSSSPPISSWNLPSGFPQNLEAYAGMLNLALQEAASGEKKEEFIRFGYLPLSGDQPLLDVHVVARLDESIAQESIIPLTRLLQETRPVSLKFRLYFYLGVDTTQWINLNQDQQSALKQSLNRLNEFLVDEVTRSGAAEDGLRICYLVDTIDEETRTIASSHSASPKKGDRLTALAEMVAGFLAILMCSEIPELPEYMSLDIINYLRQSMLPKNQGYCSSLGLASLIFPIHYIRRSLVLEWALELLNRLTPAYSTDREQSNNLVFEFSTQYRLDQATLRERLIRDDETATPLRFVFDPTSLDGVPAEELVDQILSWAAMVELNRLPPALKQIEDHAHEVISQIESWLHQQVDDLVLSPLGGSGTARLMCLGLKAKVAELRSVPKSGNPKHRHWISELFLSTSDEEDLRHPDLKLLQYDLQHALGERVLRLGVWQRFAIFASFEIVYFLAAWPFLRTALQTSLGEIVGNSFAQIGLWIALPLIILANVLAAFYTILRSEQKAARARNKLIEAIQQECELKIKQKTDQQLALIYDRLEVLLDGELAEIENWINLAKTLADEISDHQIDDLEEITRSHEKALSQPRTAEEFIPQIDASEADLVFARMINEQVLGNWRAIEKTHLMVMVLRFLDKLVPEQFRDVSINNFIDKKRGKLQLDRLIQDLQDNTKIQLNLAGFPTSHRLGFLGVDDRRLSQVANLSLDNNKIKVVTTLDRGRISYIETVHGLPLEKLKIWESLR